MSPDAGVENYLSSIGIPTEFQKLITQAQFDLYCGPIVGDPEYPGFETATDTLRDYLDVIDDIYVDLQCDGWSTEAPTGFEDDDGHIVEPCGEDFLFLSSGTVKRQLLGTELAKYI